MPQTFKTTGRYHKCRFSNYSTQTGEVERISFVIKPSDHVIQVFHVTSPELIDRIREDGKAFKLTGSEIEVEFSINGSYNKYSNVYYTGLQLINYRIL